MPKTTRNVSSKIFSINIFIYMCTSLYNKSMLQLIDDEVAPRLEKLRSDKVLFMDYQKLQRDLEANTRLYVAYRYLTHKKNLENLVKDNAKIEDDIANFHQKIKSNETENENIDQKVIDMQEHSSEV